MTAYRHLIEHVLAGNYADATKVMYSKEFFEEAKSAIEITPPRDGASEREAVIEIATDLSHFAWSMVSVATPEAGANLQGMLDRLRAAIRNLKGQPQ